MGHRTRLSDVFDRPYLAARHWVVTTRELNDADFSDERIRHLAAIGLLHRVHRGVYAVGRDDLTFEGCCRAASLASGPGSAIWVPTAGRIWGFRKDFGPIHVAIPRGRRGHPGLIAHRPRSLPPGDIAERRGASVITVGRTLLELAPTASVERIGGWIHEAGVQGVFDAQEVWAVLTRHPRHPGARRLEAALAAEVAPTRSGLEDQFLAICRRARTRRPVVNAELWSGQRDEEVDFHWPAQRVIVETDGARYHASRWRRRRDAAKDERFRAEGWDVWRIPELQITLDPASVVAGLADRGLSDPSAGRVR